MKKIYRKLGLYLLDSSKLFTGGIVTSIVNGWSVNPILIVRSIALATSGFIIYSLSAD